MDNKGKQKILQAYTQALVDRSAAECSLERAASVVLSAQDVYAKCMTALITADHVAVHAIDELRKVMGISSEDLR